MIEPQRRVRAKTLAAFLGWYVAEGNCSISAVASSILRAVHIAQVKASGREQISRVLDELPWTWHWTETCAVLSSKQLYDYLQRECWGLHHEKRVPQWIKNADVEIIAAFVDAAVAGDGWIQYGYRSYATTSKRLADDMAELFLKLGGSPSVSERLPTKWHIREQEGANLLPQYHVRENNRRKSAALDGKGRRFMVKERGYRGMVYCATVPNGTLVVRRAGKMMIAGNCAIYARAAASAAGLDRFEERHWRELERQLGLTPPPAGPPPPILDDPSEATPSGGLGVSGTRPAARRVIKSRWLSR